MQYGYFDDTHREYVITTPRTPWPWINYLGTQEFYSIISNTAGGYCFYRDARLRRITRYRYNSVPRDNTGRYFYIWDSGDVWSTGWMPVKKELDKYECRHGMGYTQIAGARGGIEARCMFFVPLDISARSPKLIKIADREAQLLAFANPAFRVRAGFKPSAIE